MINIVNNIEHISALVRPVRLYTAGQYGYLQCSDCQCPMSIVSESRGNLKIAWSTFSYASFGSHSHFVLSHHSQYSYDQMIIIFLLVLTFADANQIHYNIIKELIKYGVVRSFFKYAHG